MRRWASCGILVERKGEYMSGYEKSAHLYDLFDQKENVAFFGRYATPGEEILDVGAGTGRITIPLAERGCASSAWSRPRLCVNSCGSS